MVKPITINIPQTVSARAREIMRGFPIPNRTDILPDPLDIEGWANLRELVEREYEPVSNAVIEQYQPNIIEREIAGLPVLDIRPSGWVDDGRVLIYAHGGGYTLFSARSTLNNSVPVSADTGLRVISIDYTTAPDAKWREIISQVATVIKSLYADGQLSNKTAIYGDSAGGAIAAGVVLKMRDDGEDMPAAIVLMSPWSDITQTGDTCETLANADPILYYPETLQRCADAYAPPDEQKHPYVSPVYADYSKGFPPTLIQVGTKEILLSAAVRHYQALDGAGVPVTFDPYEGMWHVFQSFDWNLDESKTARKKMKIFLDHCLEKE